MKESRTLSYLGVTWQKSFGDTRRLMLRESGDPSRRSVLVGARMWFKE